MDIVVRVAGTAVEEARVVEVTIAIGQVNVVQPVTLTMVIMPASNAYTDLCVGVPALLSHVLMISSHVFF